MDSAGFKLKLRAFLDRQARSHHLARMTCPDSELSGDQLLWRIGL